MAAAAILAGAGGATSAMGSLLEGEAGKQAGEYNADVALQNAQITRDQTKEAVRRQRIMARRSFGDIRASYGASGVSMDGSALDVLMDSVASAEMDSMSTAYAGEMKARGFENEAAMEKFKGKVAKKAGYFGAVSSTLRAGGQVAGQQGGK
jgi:hypothetical protein